MSKKALIIIAFQGFRDEEYLEPKKILEENGVEVTTASWEVGTATGKLGAKANVDITLKEVDTSGFDTIIYVGGPGCKQYWGNPQAHRIARKTLVNKKLLAAICSAPVILARAGLLKDKKATCYSGDAEELKREGAIYTGNALQQDGLIITADGPGSAGTFGERIVEALKRG